MTTTKWWLVGAMLVIALVVLAGFTLGISPKLEEVSATRATRTAALAQNEVYELQLAALQRQFDGLETVQDELAVLRAAIPGGAALPAFIGQLDAIAGRTSVTVTEFSSADAMPYLPVVPDTTVPDTTAPDSTAPDSTAPDSTAPGTDGAGSAAPSQLVTAENFIAVPVTISVAGSFDAVLEFLDGVQNAQRLMTVTSFSSGMPSADTPDLVTGQIAGIVYVLLNAG
ncbi:type 4a pilus biogenesis protein PilO [Cryobacterium sp. Y82]|uniref:type 4a pilus biogenesis protein PilO n=1 Tax=Cryobacterium sp. Y82 TaxID=2045017 RepID=UPI000CE3CC66|nr:type 4a pilus biogenesis protein PilO [Cryobacterium sp. Y82]